MARVFAASGAEIASIFVTVGAATDPFNRGMSEVDKRLSETAGKVNRFASGLDNIGKSAKTVGRNLSIIGVGASAGIISAVGAAKEFESAFAGVRKTVDASDEELDALRSTFISLATDISNPVSALDNAAVTLARIGELAGQLAIPVPDIGDFTEIIANLGVATNLGVEEAALGLARLRNIFQGSVEDVGSMANAITLLGNRFAVLETEIVNASLRMAGAASAVGATEADVLGISTALAAVGVPAELGGTAVQRAFLLMQQASAGASGTIVDNTLDIAAASSKLDQLEAKLRTSKAAFNQFAAAGREGAALQEQLKIDAITAEIERANQELGELQALQGLSIPTGALERFADVAGLTADEFKNLADTDPAGAFLAFIKGVGGLQDAGEDVLPILKDLGFGQQRTLNVFTRLAGASGELERAIVESNKEFTSGNALFEEAAKRAQTLDAALNRLKNVIAGVAQAFIVDLLPEITTALNGVSRFIAGLIDLPEPVKRATVIVAGLAAAIALIAGPLIFLTGQFLISAGALLNFVSAGGAVGSIISTIGFRILPLIGIVGAVTSAVSLLAIAFARDWAGIRTVAASVIGDLAPIIGALGTLIEQVVSGFQTGGITGIFDALKGGFTDFAAVVGQSLGTALSRITQWLDDATKILGRDISKITTQGEELFRAFTSWALQVGPSIVNDLGRAFGRIAGGLTRITAPLIGATARIVGLIAGAFLKIGPEIVRNLPRMFANIQAGFLDGLGPLGDQISKALNDTLAGRRLLDVGNLAEGLISGDRSAISDALTSLFGEDFVSALDDQVKRIRSKVSDVFESLGTRFPVAAAFAGGAIDFAAEGDFTRLRKVIDDTFGRGTGTQVRVGIAEISRALEAGNLSGVIQGLTRIFAAIDITTAVGTLATDIAVGLAGLIFEGIVAGVAFVIPRIPAALSFLSQAISTGIQQAFENANIEGRAREFFGRFGDLGTLLGNAIAPNLDGITATLVKFFAVGAGLNFIIGRFGFLGGALTTVLGIFGRFGAVGSIFGSLTTVLGRVGTVAASVGGAFRPLLSAILGVGNVTGRLIALFARMVVLGSTGLGLSGITGSVVGLGTAFSGLGTTLSGIIASFGGMIVAINPVAALLAILAIAGAATFIAWRKGLIDIGPLWDRLKTSVSGFFDAFSPLVDQITNRLIPALERLAALIGPPLVGAFVVLSGVIVGSFAGIGRIISSVISVVITLVSGLINLFVGIATTIQKVFTGDFEGALNSAIATVEQFVSDIKSLFAGIGLFFIGIAETIHGAIVGGWEAIEKVLIGNSIIPDLISGIKGLFNGLVTFFDTVFGVNISNAIKDAFGGIAESIGERVQSAIATISANADTLVTTIGDLGSRAKTAFQRRFGGQGIGQSFISEISSGIDSNIPTLDRANEKAARSARDWWPFSPAKKGPLSNIDQAGGALIQEIANGMEAETPELINAAKRAAGSTLDSFTSVFANERVTVQTVLDADDTVAELDQLFNTAYKVQVTVAESATESLNFLFNRSMDLQNPVEIPVVTAVKQNNQFEAVQQQLNDLNGSEAIITYSIKSGDTLTAIAKEITGDAAQFKKIWEENKDILGPDPNLIFPGQVIQIALESQITGATDEINELYKQFQQDLDVNVGLRASDEFEDFLKFSTKFEDAINTAIDIEPTANTQQIQTLLPLLPDDDVFAATLDIQTSAASEEALGVIGQVTRPMTSLITVETEDRQLQQTLASLDQLFATGDVLELGVRPAPDVTSLLEFGNQPLLIKTLPDEMTQRMLDASANGLDVIATVQDQFTRQLLQASQDNISVRISPDANTEQILAASGAGIGITLSADDPVTQFLFDTLPGADITLGLARTPELREIQELAFGRIEVQFAASPLLSELLARLKRDLVLQTSVDEPTRQLFDDLRKTVLVEIGPQGARLLEMINAQIQVGITPNPETLILLNALGQDVGIGIDQPSLEQAQTLLEEIKRNPITFASNVGDDVNEIAQLVGQTLQGAVDNSIFNAEKARRTGAILGQAAQEQFGGIFEGPQFDPGIDFGRGGIPADTGPQEVIVTFPDAAGNQVRIDNLVIQQQPGESSEFLADRVRQELERMCRTGSLTPGSAGVQIR